MRRTWKRLTAGLLIALTATTAAAAPTAPAAPHAPAPPAPAARAPTRVPDHVRLFYVTRASWGGDGGVSVFVDLANRHRVGDRVTYYAAYVLERPHPIHGALADVAVEIVQVTVLCSSRRYRFDGSVLVGTQGQGLIENGPDPSYLTVDPANQADVTEIRTVCEPPASPPAGLVFDNLGAAVIFAASLRAHAV
jgi:hypothetical protein